MHFLWGRLVPKPTSFIFNKKTKLPPIGVNYNTLSTLFFPHYQLTCYLRMYLSPSLTCVYRRRREWEVRMRSEVWKKLDSSRVLFNFSFFTINLFSTLTNLNQFSRQFILSEESEHTTTMKTAHFLLGLALFLFSAVLGEFFLFTEMC